MNRGSQPIQVINEEGGMITIELDVTALNKCLQEQKELECELEEVAKEGRQLVRTVLLGALGLSFIG